MMETVERALVAWHLWQTPGAVLRSLREAGPDAVDQGLAELDITTQRDLRQAASTLAESGIGALMIDRAGYPEQLRTLRSPPAILFYAGDAALLDQPSLGVCGARAASPDGLRAAAELGRFVASRGYAVVAGNAPGVDVEVQQAAIDAGGAVIIVLPEGVSQGRVQTGADDGGVGTRLLVLSQFPPNQAWSVGGAMGRNSLIAALSKALVVVEAGNSGGSLAAGEAALRMGRPVFTYEFDQGTPVGNAMLIKKGAVGVRAPQEVADAIRTLGDAEPTHVNDQLTLAL